MERDVIDRIKEACMDAGQGTIGGKTIDSPDRGLLDVRDGDFDEHVAMQPAAIAYYGTVYKSKIRQLERIKSSYERWQKRKHQEARQSLEKSMPKKPTISDIESFMAVNYAEDIEKWEDEISDIQEDADTMEQWYQSWKQKSFSLREYGLTLSDERKTSPYIMGQDGEGVRQPTLDKLKKIRQARKED